MTATTTASSRPSPTDFLSIGATLSEHESMWRDTVRRFVHSELAPHIANWFEDGAIPREVAKELGSLGLMGVHLDGYGCAGGSAVDYGLACQELEACDSGIRSMVSVQGSLAMFPLWKYGSAEQKQQWLPGMARGELIGCFGLTEPDAGSDPARMRTVARRAGSDWILSGTKMWITNGSIADVAIVWARDESSEGRVRGFVVPTTTPGFSAPTIERKLSLRASVTSQLVLDDVRVPSDAVLPGIDGLRGPLSCLDEARFGILWGAAGAARACYEAALDYASTRQQFGRSISGFQLTQSKLVEMMLAVNKAALVAMHLGRLKDARGLHSAEVSFGKLDNVRSALQVARTARTILGANGITLDYGVMRHAVNLESVLTYEGTSEIHTLIMGEILTGISAFR